jgi:hypothetical protein
MCQGVVKIDQRKGKHHGLAEYLCRGRGSDQVGPFLSLPHWRASWRGNRPSFEKSGSCGGNWLWPRRCDDDGGELELGRSTAG